MKKNWKKILLSALVVIFTVAMIFARPGGGHSYYGGSSGGGMEYGSGGGGNGLGMLIYLIFRVLPPEISIPLLIGFVLYLMWRNRKSDEDFSLVSEPTYFNTMSSVLDVSKQIAQLKAIDPNFSRVLFLDFVSSLYTKFYMYHNDGNLAPLTPFFDKNVLVRDDKIVFKISEIVIGNISIEQIYFTSDKVKIAVRFNANMTITYQGRASRYVLEERWILQRDKNVISPEPEKMHTLTCPACGAPADFTDAGVCKHCGTLIVQGKMQWFVVDRKIYKMTVYHTKELLTYAPERGTYLPTIKDVFLEQRIKAFENAHNVQWPGYWQKFTDKIVKQYFAEIYKAWSQLKWNQVRHLISDRLWESYNYWIKAYAEHGYRNMLDVRITDIELAKIEMDRFYEAITVRIYATGLDYVVDRQGRVLAGSNKRERKFSEYWTFIRRFGVEKDDYDIHTCPACGAPADKIGQAGICEYCGNKITWGDFSWILAIITQDEEYKG